MVTPKKVKSNEQKFQELCEHFEKWVNLANQEGRSDSPARYFHMKTVGRIKAIGLNAIFEDELFFEYLYATLVSWGMDRAKKDIKLYGFHDFVNGLRKHRQEIIKFSSQSLATINSMEEDSAFNVIEDIWELARDVSGSLSKRESTLVLGTKTLHHLLPDLFPPIDREYTLGFFSISGEERIKFGYVFTKYLDIYKSRYAEIEKLIKANPFLNSSVTKTIDNAIIGYETEAMKEAKK